MRSQRKLIEYPASIYWNSNEKLSKIEWTSIEHPTNVYRASNEHLSRIDVERIRFLIKHALCGYSELCFLCRRGSNFQKNHRTRATEGEKGSKNYVGHVKISPKWCRIHEDVHKIMSNTSLTSTRDATCNNNTHICYVFSLIDGFKLPICRRRSFRMIFPFFRSNNKHAHACGDPLACHCAS